MQRSILLHPNLLLGIIKWSLQRNHQRQELIPHKITQRWIIINIYFQHLDISTVLLEIFFLLLKASGDYYIKRQLIFLPTYIKKFRDTSYFWCKIILPYLCAGKRKYRNRNRRRRRGTSWSGDWAIKVGILFFILHKRNFISLESGLWICNMYVGLLYLDQ